MSDISKLQKFLQRPAKMVLIGHMNPDGDAVGSLLAWGEYLERKGHHVTLLVPNDPPLFLRSMDGFSQLRSFRMEEVSLVNAIKEAEVIFAMDFNEMETRIGALSEALKMNDKAARILIDHHLNPPLEQFDLSFSDSAASSTALIVYRLIRDLGDLDSLTLSMAKNIYIGMMTDTGNFSYGHLTGELYRIIADLVERGVAPAELNVQIFNVYSESRMRLIGYSLHKKMTLLNANTAYVTLSMAELNYFHYRPGDTEGLVNMLLSIGGVNLSALFTETNECIKISLRSQGANAVDVNQFARTWFSGGGHRNAAGAKSFASMEETLRRFEEGVRAL